MFEQFTTSIISQFRIAVICAVAGLKGAGLNDSKSILKFGELTAEELDFLDLAQSLGAGKRIYNHRMIFRKYNSDGQEITVALNRPILFKMEQRLNKSIMVISAIYKGTEDKRKKGKFKKAALGLFDRASNVSFSPPQKPRTIPKITVTPEIRPKRNHKHGDGSNSGGSKSTLLRAKRAGWNEDEYKTISARHSYNLDRGGSNQDNRIEQLPFHIANSQPLQPAEYTNRSHDPKSKINPFFVNLDESTGTPKIESGLHRSSNAPFFEKLSRRLFKAAKPARSRSWKQLFGTREITRDVFQQSVVIALHQPTKHELVSTAVSDATVTNIHDEHRAAYEAPLERVIAWSGKKVVQRPSYLTPIKKNVAKYVSYLNI